jgi:predicted metalloendopeptidase
VTSSRDILDDWCALPEGYAGVAACDELFDTANEPWNRAHPDAPPSLLQALSSKAEAQCDALIARHVEVAEPADPLASLHRLFVTAFDSERERRSCAPDVAIVAEAASGDRVLPVLAELTRRGYGSPLYLTVQRLPGTARAAVVPRLHPAPLPPADFADQDRMSAYGAHMQAMVAALGGRIERPRMAGVIELDRRLWSTTPPAAGRPFPWTELLGEAIGERGGDWSSLITAGVRQGMDAWWAATAQQQADWMLCRLAYDFVPFLSESTFVANSLFFAGRVLGLTKPRSRPERFVSLAKTVFPAGVAARYVDAVRDASTLRRANYVARQVHDRALVWAGSVGLEDETTRRLETLTVDLGESGSQARDTPRPADPSVCDAIRAARRREVSEAIDLLDGHHAESRWRVQPYTAAAYHNAGSNAVVVPWALLTAPLVVANPPIQTYALFGALVGHEIAHAVLPRNPDSWSDFVDRIGIGPVLDRYRHSIRGSAGRAARTQQRELVADALGYAWAHAAACPRRNGVGAGAREEQDFLAAWATRWRGSRTGDDHDRSHVDRHPPTRLRCDLAPTYVHTDHPTAVRPPVQGTTRKMRTKV